jgi:two-component system sensor histidine kinase KdpD
MLLQPKNVSPEQRQDLLHVIQQETQGLRRLMGEAIHLARIDAKRMKLESEPLRVDELIAAAIQSLGERAASYPIGVELTDDAPWIFADRELMVQALKQLLDNAIKYSPARSAITIAASEANGVVSVSVRDQGQGLTELEQRRVFDKFYRGHRDRSAVQGTGMGLAIAREIAEAHGGSIAVESQLGQGSRFTITMQSAAGRARLGSLTA